MKKYEKILKNIWCEKNVNFCWSELSIPLYKVKLLFLSNFENVFPLYTQYRTLFNQIFPNTFIFPHIHITYTLIILSVPNTPLIDHRSSCIKQPQTNSIPITAIVFDKFTPKLSWEKAVKFHWASTQQPVKQQYVGDVIYCRRPPKLNLSIGGGGDVYVTGFAATVVKRGGNDERCIGHHVCVDLDFLFVFYVAGVD